MTQTDLFTVTRTMHGRLTYGPTFHGPDVTTDDHDRLTGLLARVANFMADGKWHTVTEIQRACGGNEASCGARLRQLERQYGYTKTRVADKILHPDNPRPGLFWFRVVKEAK